MSEATLQIDIRKWVDRAKADKPTYHQRQASEITLNAIAATVPLNERLYLKGGVLMGLAYNSPRQTGDIDLTADMAVGEETGEQIRDLMNAAFPRAAARLGYADMVLRVQSVKGLPAGYYPDAEFPALKLKIAYAERGGRQEEALSAGKAANVIDLDISFNEPTKSIQILQLTGGEELRAYSLVDLISEKYRAMLQQVSRNRNRRQDVYDLDILISALGTDGEIRAAILETLIEKCLSRHIKATQESINDPEVKRRSGADWNTMKLEVGEVPDFEPCFERISEFYRRLPWSGDE